MRLNWGAVCVGLMAALAILAGPCAAPATAQVMNIEIDYMVLRDQNNNVLHSHRPSAAEVNAVEQMFACHGITLNIVVDDEIPHLNVIPDNPFNDKTIFGFSTDPNSFFFMKAAYFDNAGGPWHYCIFGHQYQLEGATTGSSGLAEFGDDLVVTLGGWPNQIGSPFDRASTLAHEFGHNLGLSHCGSMDCGDVGPGPILMPSIMSYNYQLEGVRTNMLCHGLTQEVANLFKEMDYSDGRMCALTETALSEAFGTGMMQVDWNCNGVISGTANVDLDNVYDDDTWCGAGGGSETLVDYNEWANLIDLTVLPNKRLLEEDAKTHPPCISYQEVAALREMRDAAGHCTQPGVSNEPCIDGEMVFLDPSASLAPDGRCVRPYSTLTSAAAAGAVPNNSVLYLRAGTYTEPGGSLVVTKPMLITSVGTATISTASAPQAVEEPDSTATSEP